MNNNQISNPKVEVPAGTAMNDTDYITSILTCEKDMSVNLVYALNEASNEVLFGELYPIFEETKQLQRKIYELMFRKGWYKIEKAEPQKINQTYTEVSGKLGELL